jgi:branched-chain amino acid transport system ATP-binding protein
MSALARAAMLEPALAAAGINTFYGQSHILRNVDFRVMPRETVSLLGRNGMGKTTLLRTLMGLVRARSGHVHLDGRDISGARPSAIARMGLAFVPEDRGIFPNLSVIENLTFAARAGRGARPDWTLPRVYELFPRLAERQTHWGNQLSGGEQKMLAIGRALMTNPDLLLLDEATEGLAPKVRDEIWATLRLVTGRDRHGRRRQESRRPACALRPPRGHGQGCDRVRRQCRGAARRRGVHSPPSRRLTREPRAVARVTCLHSCA